MSEFSTPDQRTEMPTDRRLQHLRREGMLHMSFEVGTVVSLITGFLMLKLMWSGILDDVKQVLTICFGAIAHVEPFTAHSLRAGFIKIALLVAPRLLLLMIVVSVVASLAILLQTNFNVKEKKIKFKFNMLNPVEGLKKIFSIHGVMNTAKALVKLALILPIGFYALQGLAPQMVLLIHTSVPQVMGFTGLAIMEVFWKIIYVLSALAVFDYLWGRYQWLRTNKMTKDEVKDERKAIEGDEETKRRLMWKGIERVMQRIKQGVKKADVVITNPTHYAVALQYDRGAMSAPVVVAKGMGFMALRIREMAREAGIPVVERKPLARALYRSVEVGGEIPYELFKAVAEVLAYVYRLRNPNRNRTQASAS